MALYFKSMSVGLKFNVLISVALQTTFESSLFVLDVFNFLQFDISPLLIREGFGVKQ